MPPLSRFMLLARRHAISAAKLHPTHPALSLGQAVGAVDVHIDGAWALTTRHHTVAPLVKDITAEKLIPGNRSTSGRLQRGWHLIMDPEISLHCHGKHNRSAPSRRDVCGQRCAPCSIFFLKISRPLVNGEMRRYQVASCALFTEPALTLGNVEQTDSSVASAQSIACNFSWPVAPDCQSANSGAWPGGSRCPGPPERAVAELADTSLLTVGNSGHDALETTRSEK